MREIQPDAFKVFKLDELTSSAYDTAIGGIAALLAEQWCDDNANVMDEIHEGLCGALGTPEVNGTYGEVPGVKVVGWDLGRGQYVSLDGTLTRENAPSLPWRDGIHEVYLSAQRDHTHVGVASEGDTYDDADRAMHEAVRDAIHEAWKAAHDALDYITSEENVEAWISDNEPEFHEDGSLYS